MTTQAKMARMKRAYVRRKRNMESYSKEIDKYNATIARTKNRTDLKLREKDILLDNLHVSLNDAKRRYRIAALDCHRLHKKGADC